MSNTAVVQHADVVMRIAQGMPVPQRATPSLAIGDSWRRCVHDYALDPVRSSAPSVVASSDLKERHGRHEELVQIASAEMDSLYDQICGSGYALLLTDANGIILCEKIDPTIRRMFRSAGLIVGADWSEHSEGTNGIGTCITENRPITVHGAEHFRARHIDLSCSGAPIHDSAGELLAVLDASTVDARASQAHTMALVSMSAQMIEKCVFLRRHQQTTVVRFHLRPELVDLLHDGALALSDDGTVLAADATAVRLLGASSRSTLVGRQLQAIFDARLDDLLAPRSPARQALWPLRDLALGRRFFASVHLGRDAAARAWPPAHVEPRPAARSGGGTREMTLDELAGVDEHMMGIVNRARRIVNAALPVMIQGPTGAGKECFARALHAASERRDRAFVAVNCGALPETLIESELFGYRPGAFTGASKEGLRGRIAQSSGGTLFLDEIGDMPLMLQTRFLRVLDQQEIAPLGAAASIKVDLHVICATHRNVREMVARGEFREDLYYRLNGIAFELPPLAARTDKVQLIRDLLAAEAPGSRVEIAADAFQCLLAYRWPGNVRELRNTIRSALAVCEGNVVQLGDLPREIREQAPAADSVHSCAAGRSIALDVPARSENPVRAALLQAIEAHNGNLARAAKSLGISRNTLYRRLERHCIPVVRIKP